jgi:hypothetical protein
VAPRREASLGDNNKDTQRQTLLITIAPAATLPMSMTSRSLMTLLVGAYRQAGWGAAIQDPSRL